MHFNRRKFRGASEQFHSTSQILGSKMLKSTFFEDKWDLSAVFIELKGGWIQTGLTDIKKRKTLEMLLRADFLRIF